MKRFTAEDLIRLRRVTSVAPSPDGTWLAVAAQRLDEEKGAKYVSDLWRLPLDGREAVQLTCGDHDDRAPAFLHDGSLAFLSNRPTGNDPEHEKRSQVFAFRPAGGDPIPLTDEPLGVSAFRSASLADVVVVAAATLPDVPYDEQREAAKRRREEGPSGIVYDRMPVRFWDHWLPLEAPHLIAYIGGERRDLTPDYRRQLLRGEWDLAADGSVVAVNPTRPGSDRIEDQWCELIDLDSGASRVLASRQRTWFASPLISPDARTIALSRRVRRDGAYGMGELCLVDVDTGEQRVIGADLDTWLTPQAWTEDGAEVLCVGAWKTHAPVFAVDTETGASRRITSESVGGSHGGVAVVPGGGFVSGVRSSRLEPPEAFTCSLDTGSEPQPVQRISGFEKRDWTVQDAFATSTDGASVHYAIVCDPTVEKPPILNWIHGGPIGDWGDVWHWRWNPLVAADAGFAVVLPNPRGSIGFGQEFVEGIWNNSWGGQCYEDLIAVFDDVEARPDLDATRTIAMGGSFGGYMTNWIATQTDRFSCLVTHASLFDLAAFHGVTDLPAWWSFSFGVHPYRRRAEFDRYSPIAHVENWRTPTLIIHGDRDYRVPVGEALSLFEALRFHDVEARLLVYPDENHWILRPRNIVHWYSSVLEFIDEYTQREDQ